MLRKNVGGYAREKRARCSLDRTENSSCRNCAPTRLLRFPEILFGGARRGRGRVQLTGGTGGYITNTLCEISLPRGIPGELGARIRTTNVPSTPELGNVSLGRASFHPAFLPRVLLASRRRDALVILWSLSRRWTVETRATTVATTTLCK